MSKIKRRKAVGKANRQQGSTDGSVSRITKEPTKEPNPRIKRLIAAGLLRPATKHWRMPNWKPVRIHGPSIAQTIRDERDDS
jgi:hypothetical protein